MANWLIPALKAVLPHVGDIVSRTLPVFTRKKSDGQSADVVQQQIVELQAAVAQSAGHIQELAAQLQSTVAALEQAAAQAEARLRRAVVLGAIAGALSVVALFVALAAISLR
jgi:TolA-binding protein